MQYFCGVQNKLAMNRFFIFIIPVLLLAFAFRGETHAQSSGIKSHDVKFKKHILDPVFVSEGVAVGDVNNDGKRGCTCRHFLV